MKKRLLNMFMAAFAGLLVYLYSTITILMLGLFGYSNFVFVVFSATLSILTYKFTMSQINDFEKKDRS